MYRTVSPPFFKPARQAWSDGEEYSKFPVWREVVNYLKARLSPYFLGFTGGITFDILAKLTGKKFPVSAVRVKKFCATTQFDAIAAHSSGFKAPFSLAEGLHRTLQYEFINKNKDGITFKSE